MNIMFQERLASILEKLEGVEGGSVVEGLPVAELTALPRPSPLLEQWSWRQPTCPLQQPQQVSAHHWFGSPGGLEQDTQDTGKNSLKCIPYFLLEVNFVLYTLHCIYTVKKWENWRKCGRKTKKDPQKWKVKGYKKNIRKCRENEDKS